MPLTRAEVRRFREARRAIERAQLAVQEYYDLLKSDYCTNKEQEELKDKQKSLLLCELQDVQELIRELRKEKNK